MRLAVGFLVSVGAYVAVSALLYRYSSVLREVERREFTRRTLFYALCFAGGLIFNYAEVSRWPWSILLVSTIVFAAITAPLMNAGWWFAARLMRWARTGH